MNGRYAGVAQGGAGQALLPALRRGLGPALSLGLGAGVRAGWATGLRFGSPPCLRLRGRLGVHCNVYLGVRLGAAILAWLPAAMAGAQPVSPAEVLLFETDHLARIKPPASLVYAFRKQSNVEPAYIDTVQLDVSRKQGQLHAALRFLSGERSHALPEIDDVHGNPVLLGFLEHDIAEMKRLTGGAAGYFRKRIRLALASAQVKPERISYAGKTVDARAVRIQPYLDDPLHARFENYVRKTYTFVLSDQVPGGVYQISTTLANAAGNGPASGTAAARKPASGEARPAPVAAAADPGVASATAAHAAARALNQPDAAKQPGSVNPPGAANQSGAEGPGATAPGASLPVIDETLTLVKVTEPRR